MQRAGQPKPYDECHGTHFLNFVSADGKLWECNVHAGDERFLIGDLHDGSFQQAWASKRREAVLRFIEDRLDIGRCRGVCRLDACNRYLYRLRHPEEHDNFI